MGHNEPGGEVDVQDVVLVQVVGIAEGAVQGNGQVATTGPGQRHRRPGVAWTDSVIDIPTAQDSHSAIGRGIGDAGIAVLG